jgi:hypothetical protein
MYRMLGGGGGGSIGYKMYLKKEKIYTDAVQVLYGDSHCCSFNPNSLELLFIHYLQGLVKFLLLGGGGGQDLRL